MGQRCTTGLGVRPGLGLGVRPGLGARGKARARG